jgi:hypothetical protein
MTEHITPDLSRGYIVQLDRTPGGLGVRLEQSGSARMASRTVEGLYVEPEGSLGALVTALEEQGFEIHGLRSVSAIRGWEAQKPFRRNRLRNPLSACWVPGLKGA